MAPSGPGLPRYRDFKITLRHTTHGRTPLDEWSSRRRDLYLTTHNTHKRHTNIPPTGFEPAIPASERPQTYVLDRAATRIGSLISIHENNHKRTSTVAVNSAYRVQHRMSLGHHTASSHTPFMDRAREALIRTACVPWCTTVDKRRARLPSYTRCIKHQKLEIRLHNIYIYKFNSYPIKTITKTNRLTVLTQIIIIW